jgi:hypothetical protein
MELDRFISQMANNAQRIRALAEGVSREQARWKPDPDSWSILEVINHMRDVEREDFRVLLDLALHRPDEARPRIAPQAWVAERRYSKLPRRKRRGFGRRSARHAVTATYFVQCLQILGTQCTA